MISEARRRRSRRSAFPASAGRGARGRRAAIEIVLLLLVALLMAVALRSFVAEAFRIPSSSMEPQLMVGDRVLVSRLAYRLHDPRRGDVAVFDCPPRAGCLQPPRRGLLLRGVVNVLEAVMLRHPEPEEYIKRVIGLPGETVQGKKGSVWIDGHRLVEPYLPKGTITSDFGPVRIRAGHVWMMGDNRLNSSDSRVFGQVADDTLVGRAMFRAWPPWRGAFL